MSLKYEPSSEPLHIRTPLTLWGHNPVCKVTPVGLYLLKADVTV